MGVTYKLRQEVIDCIIEKKKQEPALSCRKLTSIIYDKFQLDVSKSSINAVIKEFALSNPVGRRPLKPSRNFNIPAEKKEQLFAQVVPFLPQDVPEHVPLLPDLLKQTVVQQQVKPAAALKPLPVPMDNGGLFFVRAMMQDMLRRPMIGQAMAREAHEAGLDEDVLEAAVFLGQLGVSSVEDIHGSPLAVLWEMFEVSARQGEDVLDRFFGKSMDLSSLAMMLDIELRAAFTEGCYFKLMTSAGRAFYLSADLTSVLAGPESGTKCPAFKSVQLAVERMVLGAQPLVLDMKSGIKDVCIDVLQMFEGKIQEKLDKIELWSNNDEILWEHAIEIGHKIDFIARINKKDSVSDIEFRSIPVGENVLLTNISPGRLSIDGAVDKYLERMSYIDVPLHKYHSFEAQESEIMGIYSKKVHIFNNIDTLMSFLNDMFKIFDEMTFSALFFFDVKRTIYDEILKVPASVQNTSLERRIMLHPGKSFAHGDVLAIAINRANRLYFTDYQNRKYAFSLAQAAE